MKKSLIITAWAPRHKLTWAAAPLASMRQSIRETHWYRKGLAGWPLRITTCQLNPSREDQSVSLSCSLPCLFFFPGGDRIIIINSFLSLLFILRHLRFFLYESLYNKEASFRSYTLSLKLKGQSFWLYPNIHSSAAISFFGSRISQGISWDNL